MPLKIITQQERYDIRKLVKMQSLPIYSEMVRRLNSGQNATQVARWALTHHLGEPYMSWGWFSWIEHVKVVKRAVEQAKARLVTADFQRRRNAAPQAPTPEAVEQQVEQIAADATFADIVIPKASKVFNDVQKVCKLMREEVMVKVAYVQQLERVVTMREMEDAIKMSMPFVTAAIGMLGKLAVESSTIAYKEKMIALKTTPLGAEFAYPDGPRLETEKEMESLDEVDKNILRELAVRTIDMVQENAGGRFKANGDSADGRTEEPAQGVADAKTSGPSVAEGS